MPFSIFANHAHVFPESINPKGTFDRLAEHLEACAISGAVCFAPFPHVARTINLDPIAWMVEQLRSRPHLRGFGTIDFQRKHFADQVKRIADFGLLGLKMHPNSQEFDVLGADALAVYEAAERHKLFITFHTGVHAYRLKHYQVLLFDEIAHQFPTLRFSMEHVGGYSFFNEALAVIFNNIPFPPVPGKRPMVFGGLTSIFTADHNQFWHLTHEQLRTLVSHVGAEQLIFGLDFPYNEIPHTQLGIHTIREELGLSVEQQALILGGNLRRELGLGGH